MSHVSGLIVPFISQGPKGPRGIKGAPGDRGQMGERVRVGDREGERQMCPMPHILWLPWGFWEYLDGSVSVFLYFRETMVSKEMALQVVMVSRYVLIVVHVCHVHMTLYSEDLCLFFLGLSWAPRWPWWAGKRSFRFTLDRRVFPTDLFCFIAHSI